MQRGSEHPIHYTHPYQPNLTSLVKKQVFFPYG